ncbi:hypothetical protein [Streptomyces sp. NPDC087294]|uniref:hypothetical protein n=1 Tax=Streptomyces sp. NPDC087294 TaxID=3365777 RepID=UPI00380C682D
MSADGPTERQVQILRALRAWIAEHGVGPDKGNRAEGGPESADSGPPSALFPFSPV